MPKPGHTNFEARELYCSADTNEKCCGASCMAWRWLPSDAHEDDVHSAISKLYRDRGAPGIAAWESAEADVTANPTAFGLSDRRGFCGLAGKP